MKYFFLIASILISHSIYGISIFSYSEEFNGSLYTYELHDNGGVSDIFNNTGGIYSYISSNYQGDSYLLSVTTEAETLFLNQFIENLYSNYSTSYPLQEPVMGVFQSGSSGTDFYWDSGEEWNYENWFYVSGGHNWGSGPVAYSGYVSYLNNQYPSSIVGSYLVTNYSGNTADVKWHPIVPSNGGWSAMIVETDLSSVPEPSTYTLILGGLALGFVALRRK